MYRHCTTEKTAAQQRLFERTLLEATKHQPYQDISVSQLCLLSGLSRKTFYRLFENKDDVLVALLDHTLMDYIHYAGSSDSIGGEILSEPASLFAYWRQHEQILDLLDQAGKTSLLLERTVNHVMTEQQEVKLHFGVADHPYAEDILRFYFSGIMGLLTSWHKAGYTRTEEQMADLMNELLYTAPVKHAKGYYFNK